MGLLESDNFYNEPTPECQKNMELYSKDVRARFALSNELRPGVTIILSDEEIDDQMDVLDQVLDALLEENLDWSYDDIVKELGVPEVYVHNSLEFIVMPF